MGLNELINCFGLGMGGKAPGATHAGRDTVIGIPGHSLITMACHVGEPLTSGECMRVGLHMSHGSGPLQDEPSMVVGAFASDGSERGLRTR